MEGINARNYQVSTINDFELIMGTIRITSGEYGRRVIETPGGDTHPMGERERLALFNTISAIVPAAVVIDAYSGSGALGIEALSRKAKKVLFIENNTAAMKIIKNNCLSLGIDRGKTEFYLGSVMGYYQKDYRGHDVTKAEIILADPPYNHFDIKDIKILISFLKPGGVLVLSHPEDAPSFEGLRLTKTKQYAKAHLSFYEKPTR